MKSTVRFSVQQGWKVIIADMGFDQQALLKKARLPADLFHRSDATLSVDDFFALWHGMETLADHDAIPLLIGQHVSVESFDPPVFAALCSPNLTVAFERLAHYKRLVGPMILTLDQQPGRVVIDIECYGYNRPLPKSLALSELTFMLALARLGTRRHIQPMSVTVPAVPIEMAPYESYFGVPIQQGKHTRIEFSSQDAVQPFMTHNLGMWHYFEQELQQRLDQLDQHNTTIDRVKSLLLELLPSGQASAEAVAEQLAMSKRTLQRKLSAEGKPFRELLQETRQQLATHYLRDKTLSTGEISFLLGFADGNSFIRAFHHWTGYAPGHYRTLSNT